MWKLLHFSCVLINRLNTTESAVFLYCRFSLFLKDPFFQIIKYYSQSDFGWLICQIVYKVARPLTEKPTCMKKFGHRSG